MLCVMLYEFLLKIVLKEVAVKIFHWYNLVSVQEHILGDHWEANFLLDMYTVWKLWEW